MNLTDAANTRKPLSDNEREEMFSQIYKKTFRKRNLLALDVEIGCVLNIPNRNKHHWMIADVYGNISGSEYRETRDTPAEHRCIEDMEVMVNGIDIYDALPAEIVAQIEEQILGGEYA